MMTATPAAPQLAAPRLVSKSIVGAAPLLWKCSPRRAAAVAVSRQLSAQASAAPAGGSTAERRRRLGALCMPARGARPSGSWQRWGNGSTERTSGTTQRAAEASASGNEQPAAADGPVPAVPSHSWEQKTVTLPGFSRGCHVITGSVLEQLPEMLEFEVGMANFFIQHTSASLTINENASPDVPKDLNDSLDRIAPEGSWYRHSDEGPDDMPAHVKSSLMGPSLDIPIKAGQLAMGTWQGIYLNEHRNCGGPRRVVVTMQGRKRADGRKYPANQYRW